MSSPSDEEGLKHARAVGAMKIEESTEGCDTTRFTLQPLTEELAKAADENPNGKILYLVRHAQGFHNKAVAETGSDEEYKNWEWLDSRLTDVGKEQAAELASKLEKDGVVTDVVLVSPLSRAIHTGLIGFSKVGGDSIPFEALDLARERIGTHPCDKRRSKTDLSKDFPHVDFSTLLTEEDDRWTEAREPWPILAKRAGLFLDVLRSRPEKRIAVVAHNDFITALLNDVKYANELSESTRRPFTNADARSFFISW